MAPQHTRRSVQKVTGSALALTGMLLQSTGAGVDYYETPVREFTKRLHLDLPETSWGSTASSPGTATSSNTKTTR